MSHLLRVPVLLFLFLPMILLAQESSMTGRITDKESGEGLYGATIILEDKRTGTITDLKGDFELKCSSGAHTITISSVGYETEEKQVTLKEGKNAGMNITVKKSVNKLKTVVVSAGRFEQELSDVTVSMEVLKPEMVENRNTTSMESAINQVPSVHITDGQCNIRGGSGFSYGAGSRVLLLVDGLPILSADASDVKWNFLPVENLEQIEVIKGASSALFGSAALNGVINVRTAYPKDEPQTKINVYHGMYFDPVRADSLGDKRDSLGELRKPLRWWGDVNPTYTGMNFFHSRKMGKFDLVVGGNILSNQGWREGEDEQRFRMNFNTRYRFKKVEGLSVGLNANAQHYEGGTFLMWQDADSGAYKPMGGLDTSTTTISFLTTIRVNVDPYIIYYGKKGGRHSLRTRYFNTTNLSDLGQESIGDFYYSEYQFNKQFKRRLTLTMGAVGSRSDVFSELYGNHSGSNLGFFTQLDKKSGRLSLSLGLRGEYFKVDTAETKFNMVLGGDTTVLSVYPVVRGGLNYRLAEYTYLRTSFGQGYRFPSVAEKYVSTSVGLLNIFPNPGLQPERGWSAEVGIKQGFKLGEWTGFLDVAGFWTEYLDMMEFAFGLYNPDTVLPTFDWVGFQSQNVGKAQIKGVEATVVGKGKLVGDLGLTVLAGYTYMDPVNFNNDSAYLSTRSDSTSNMLKYRFQHLAKADVQLDYKRWSVGWSMRYNSFMVNVDHTFEEPLIGQIYITPGVKEYREAHSKGDVVFDARISCKLSDQSKVAVISNNVLNREYMGRPADMRPPRTVALQYTISL